MQAYGKSFARVYNKRWGDFARYVAPLMYEFYEATPIGSQTYTLLDLCCGTGQLAGYFLDHGYRVVGLDLSEAMLAFARENNRTFFESGQAQFVQGDASSFSLPERFGLVISSYDALNHLEDLAALRGCFTSAAEVLIDGGYFIFDLNTRVGLAQWNNLHVDDSDEEILLITRGLYDPERRKAWTRLSGFVRVEGDYYERFEQTAYNTAFALAEVRSALLETGWSQVHFARVEDLTTPLPDPESARRVFVVASK